MMAIYKKLRNRQVDDISLKATNVNLKVALGKKSKDHFKRIHPLGIMNVCSKAQSIVQEILKFSLDQSHGLTE